MTVTAPPPPAAPATSGRGGLPARRALVRWAWRLLRREWRSQLLVSLLLTFTVATAVCGGAAIANLPVSGDPRLGSATLAVTVQGTDLQGLASLRSAFPTYEAIGQNLVRAPGLAQPVDYRAQAPHGPYGGKLLGVRQGRYPRGAGEAGITSRLARLLGLHLGGAVALDGHPRTIVGIVENPSDLSDDFVLVDPAAGPPSPSLFVLVKGSQDATRAVHLRGGAAWMGVGTDNNAVVVATLVLGGATLLLLLVGFVAAAAFAVLAHRRLRQLGMLAAIGATDRQVRLVMTATGLLIGLVAAAIGAAAGLAVWPLVAGPLEPAIGHRIDVLNVPWALVAALVVMAVAMSTGAAWWPARAVSRVPVTLALTGRPPVPRHSHRPALLAAVFLALGLGCLAYAQKRHPPYLVAGTVATALAILFAAPLAIRLLAAAGSRLPVAVRLALRDLARHQARSGAAVAAISLALGIPVAIVIVATGVQATPSTGNLTASQLLIRFNQPGDPPEFLPIRTDAQLAALTGQAGQIAAVLGRPSVIPLDMVPDPSAPPEVNSPLNGAPGRIMMGLAVPAGRQYKSLPMYVADPGLLRLAGVDPARLSPSVDVVTSLRDPVLVLMRATRGARTEDHPVLLRTSMPRYTSLPATLVTQEGIARRHLTAVHAGWLVESASPLTGGQIAEARRIAAAAGLTIETRDRQGSVGTVRASATAGGMLLAIAVLAMTVGLIRSEGAADLRTLSAVGAAPGVRRTVTAATAGGLALVGVVLGTVGTCLGMLAVYRHDLAVFGRVPLVYPLLLLLGVPVLAAVAGWLLAVKEPPAISRRLAD